MRYLLLALGLAVAFVAFWVGSLVIAFSGVCATVEHRRVMSPSRRQVAVIYGGDCGAVATITSTTVVVGPPDLEDPKEDERADMVFHAYIDENSAHRITNYGPEVAATWRNDSTLVLRYGSDSRVDWAVVRVDRLTVRHETTP